MGPCPLQGNCLVNSVIYKAEVRDNNQKVQTYTGLTGGTFILQLSLMIVAVIPYKTNVYNFFSNKVTCELLCNLQYVNCNLESGNSKQQFAIYGV